MVYLILSEITLTKTGLRFKFAGKKEEINYRTIVWIYIRNRNSQICSSLYPIQEITDETKGDLVVINEKKDVYLFAEKALKQAAGKLLIAMLAYYDACLIGDSRLFRELYHTDFDEMQKICSILREIKCKKK